VDGLTIVALPGIPLIQQGDDLATVIQEALIRCNLRLEHHDVLVIASKIVSKSEGRMIDLRTITPSAEAEHYALQTGKDPRIVEMVLRESLSVSRSAPGVIVTQHRLGFISANSGIDQSNVAPGGEHILLLPEDPDHSAEHLRAALHHAYGVELGIVISDTHGRPFRLGNVGVAIGVAGVPALLDMRGQPDLFGRILRATVQGYADLIASAAHLVCGEGAEGLPVVLVRGLDYHDTTGRAADLYRPSHQDLYR
jgi:coenzyme F420-0:L-glutamate ligase/coenzyme F420-1:gamma-L-glutamate ligase